MLVYWHHTSVGNTAIGIIQCSTLSYFLKCFTSQFRRGGTTTALSYTFIIAQDPLLQVLTSSDPKNVLVQSFPCQENIVAHWYLREGNKLSSEKPTERG